MRLVFGNDPAKQIKRNRLAGSGRRLGDVEGWVEPPKEQQDLRGSRSSRVSLCFTYNHNKLEPQRPNVNIARRPGGTWPSAAGGQAGTAAREKERSRRGFRAGTELKLRSLLAAAVVTGTLVCGFPRLHPSSRRPLLIVPFFVRCKLNACRPVLYQRLDLSRRSCPAGRE